MTGESVQRKEKATSSLQSWSTSEVCYARRNNAHVIDAQLPELRCSAIEDALFEDLLASHVLAGL
jgi:hypothetical protein